MMKSTLSFVAVFALTTSVMAGGDDRDMGPVESFDSLAPVAEQIVVGDQNANTMTLTDPADMAIGTTTSGSVVTAGAHEKCKVTLGLSEYNVGIFKEALMGDYLYNIGPIDILGTSFADDRWVNYFSCVESYGK
jgi:hypothetical protein